VAKYQASAMIAMLTDLIGQRDELMDGFEGGVAVHEVH
jgi:hypothetical protein